MLRLLPILSGAALTLALIAPGAARAQAAGPASNADAAWSEGSKLVHQGVVALTAADKALGDATRRGVDALARKGSFGASSQAAAEEFRRLAGAAPTSLDAVEAQRWAAIVQTAATKWQGFQSQETDATRDLNAAIQQTQAAQQGIDAAMIQVDRGRQMIVLPQPTETQPAAAAPQSAMPALPLSKPKPKAR